MKLIGLDFETANCERGSIIQAGVAVLDDGVVTARDEWLVRPPPECDYILPEFTAVHGITEGDVAHAPRFPLVWPRLAAYLSAARGCVVIHNAPFDLGHLAAALTLYDLAPVAFDYTCSLRISRRLYPRLVNHKLDTVAQLFGHTFHHHDALDDAIACATIVAHTGIPAGFRKHFQEPA